MCRLSFGLGIVLLFACQAGTADWDESQLSGVYRSSDGGATWKNVLYVNELAGAVDLAMDPTNPRILYATTWRVQRTPYSLESGGEGSGIWKSTDGGDNWVSLSENEGLPEPPLGIAGITVSPSNPDNLYAIIEAAEGGVFRSSDAGKTWKRVNQERKLRQRAWYYSRITADPAEEDVACCLPVPSVAFMCHLTMAVTGKPYS
jgi:hypothetical protein